MIAIHFLYIIKSFAMFSKALIFPVKMITEVKPVSSNGHKLFKMLNGGELKCLPSVFAFPDADMGI